MHQMKHEKTYFFLQAPQVKCPHANWKTQSIILWHIWQKDQSRIFLRDERGTISLSIEVTVSMLPGKAMENISATWTDISFQPVWECVFEHWRNRVASLIYMSQLRLWNTFRREIPGKLFEVEAGESDLSGGSNWSRGCIKLKDESSSLWGQPVRPSVALIIIIIRLLIQESTLRQVMLLSKCVLLK